ncbi:nucleotide-binding protein [Roseomonas sp. KE2513]|uniref:Zn-ribbon domain-containing OB-fold protein n=1 Tax=Roseomonas sp. KE2513 TaxID=2479202 RepID=UPI0018DEF1EE|nr:OB-fold domain-containing protein [Roseomonas sp. KE2513]MBI0539543.1 nucleotide-binding protein [Roseomonas sp. KE2513]
MQHAPQTLDAPRPPATAGEPFRLVASRDCQSGQCVFPAIPDSSPSNPRYEPVQLSEQAVLYSFTVIHPNPKSGQAPFVLVYADFPEKARVFGRLRLPEGRRPQIGMALSAVADGAGQYSFIPAAESDK